MFAIISYKIRKRCYVYRYIRWLVFPHMVVVVVAVPGAALTYSELQQVRPLMHLLSSALGHARRGLDVDVTFIYVPVGETQKSMSKWETTLHRCGGLQCRKLNQTIRPAQTWTKMSAAPTRRQCARRIQTSQ